MSCHSGKRNIPKTCVGAPHLSINKDTGNQKVTKKYNTRNLHVQTGTEKYHNLTTFLPPVIVKSVLFVQNSHTQTLHVLSYGEIY